MNRKRIASSIIIVGIIILFLSGCNGNDDANKSSKGNKKTETANIAETTITKTMETEKPINTKTESERIILKETEKKVTFIELGSVKCIPCKKMQPIMEEIKKEYGDQVEVVFYDVWTEQGKPYAEKYRIMVIPTQIFLDKDGNEYFRHSGFFPKDELVKILKMKGVK